MDVNLQESLVLRRRLHAKETIDILNEFFKSRSEKVRQFLCLCHIISLQNSATGTVYSPNPEIGFLRDRNRTKSARRLIFLVHPSQRSLRPR